MIFDYLVSNESSSPKRYIACKISNAPPLIGLKKRRRKEVVSMTTRLEIPEQEQLHYPKPIKSNIRGSGRSHIPSQEQLLNPRPDQLLNPGLERVHNRGPKEVHSSAAGMKPRQERLHNIEQQPIHNPGLELVLNPGPILLQNTGNRPFSFLVIFTFCNNLLCVNKCVI